jgi:2-iminobutanoate/2-iminopropanoate deaminase
MKSITTSDAPSVVGPYSQAIEANGFLFCAGQIGINPKTGNLALDIEEQTHQAMKNIQAVLQAAGVDLNKVVKTTIFLADMADYATVNELYATYFTTTKPARSTVAVAQLPKDALIEIEAIATL